MRRVVASAVVVIALTGVATACRGGGTSADVGKHEARGLTAVEAAQLAVVRFGNHRTGLVRGSISAPGPAPLEAQVLIDFRRHLGLAVEDSVVRPALIAWDGERVWVTKAAAKDPFHGRVPPLGSWSGAALTKQDPVDLFLTMVLTLGSDRPENPQLLQQSSARYLRTESVGGRQLRVFSGPRAAGTADAVPRTTYWLDRDGDLIRFEAALGIGEPFVLELDRGETGNRMPDAIEQLSTRTRG